MDRFFCTLLCLGLFLPLAAQTTNDPATLLLWPEGAPGALGTEVQDRPRLFLYPVTGEQASGAAVIICPGGGYWNLAMDHEGHDVAKWFNERGVSAYVLQYRLAKHGYRHPRMLQDAQRAIRTVRANAEAWKIDSERLGIMGFSAGGHLAATTATHFDDGEAEAEDLIERQSSRPTFCILGYPVIALDAPFTHRGSRENLIGKNPPSHLVKFLSNETQVSPMTPPTFLVHTDEDRGVPPENSVMFYLALRRAGVPAELHIYRRGRHGLGMAPNDPVFSTWMERLEDWLKGMGLVK